MAIATLEEYLREFSVEIGDRILTSFPALHAPGDPVSPILGKLLRKPFAAQAVAICRRGEEAPASQLGCRDRRNGHWQDADGHGHRPRIRGGTPVRLSLCRAAAITSEDRPGNSADDPRRQDVCNRQPAVAAPRSIWPARSQRTAASEWPDCPRRCSHHAHRYEVARQIQIRMGPLGCRARARAAFRHLRSRQGEARSISGGIATRSLGAAITTAR